VLNPDDVLDFWLGPLDEEGLADDAHSARWWQKNPDFDETLRQRFAVAHAQAVAGRFDGWTSTPRGRVALVVLLDQFSRNMFRGRPGMFAADAQARELSLAGIDAGEDRVLVTDERVFLYLPLMHSEDLGLQERSVTLFEGLSAQASGRARDRISNNLRYAVAHRDIVARFGRFPHRNAVLGRPSTPEELEFLRQPGSSF
jgi:uncharacterized protein (DUF924 family)